jgi:hypothetical protein
MTHPDIIYIENNGHPPSNCISEFASRLDGYTVYNHDEALTSAEMLADDVSHLDDEGMQQFVNRLMFYCWGVKQMGEFITTLEAALEDWNSQPNLIICNEINRRTGVRPA